MRGTAGQIMYEVLKNQGVTCLFGMEDPSICIMRLIAS